jgi:hypothetical protein
MFPDHKKICNKRVGVKQIIEQPTHLLQVSQVSDVLFEVHFQLLIGMLQSGP